MPWNNVNIDIGGVTVSLLIRYIRASLSVLNHIHKTLATKKPFILRLCRILMILYVNLNVAYTYIQWPHINSKHDIFQSALFLMFGKSTHEGISILISFNYIVDP